MDYFEALKHTLFSMAFWVPVGVLIVYLKKKDRPVKRNKVTVKKVNVSPLLVSGAAQVPISTRGS